MMRNSVTQTCPHCGHSVIGGDGSNNEKQRLNAARMLARHLAYTLQICNGKNLVLLLGTTGREADNMEAITSWVASRLDHIEQWPMPGLDAVALIESLEHELKDVLQDTSFGWM